MTPRSPLPVALFTIAYLACASFFAVTRHNGEFILYIAVVLLLGCIVLLLHRRVHLPQSALWALSVWGLFHMLGGFVPVPAALTDNGSGVLYSLWLIPSTLKYDQALHAYGFAVATWICWLCVRAVPGIRPTTGILALCALASMGLGALNEIIEFFAVLTLPGTNVGGYENTGWDLVSNFTGAVIAATIIRFRSHA